MKITVETTVAAPVEEVWRAWTTPDDIKQWNAASDDWHTTAATVDLRAGGRFSSRMEARDGSMGFDFAGTYTKVVHPELIECTFGDRTLVVRFIKAFFERLLEAGKSRMAAVGACMRKLIMVCYGVLKNRTPFDPGWSKKTR